MTDFTTRPQTIFRGNDRRAEDRSSDGVCDSIQSEVEMIRIIPRCFTVTAARCVRARVWSQSAFVEGLEQRNTYGSFGKLKQLVSVSLQLDCSKQGGLLTNSSTPPSTTPPLQPSQAPVHVQPPSVCEPNSGMDCPLDPPIHCDSVLWVLQVP